VFSRPRLSVPAIMIGMAFAPNSKPPEQIGGLCILASQALPSLIARTEARTATPTRCWL